MTGQPHYPYRSGERAVLGPEVFASADGQTITWQGARYRRDHGPDAEQRGQLDAALAALGKSEIELAEARAALARVRAIGPYRKPIHGDRGQGMQMGWDAALKAVHAALDQPAAATESSPDVDPVYDPKAWETYRRDAGCGCTAPAPVDCKIPHGTGAWLCVCHRLAGPPATEPGKPQSREDASIRQFFQEPNRCTSTAGMFRCARPTGHPGGHRAGRIFWGRRADDQPAHNAGPSIAECAANDRRWPLEKTGE